MIYQPAAARDAVPRYHPVVHAHQDIGASCGVTAGRRHLLERRTQFIGEIAGQAALEGWQPWNHRERLHGDLRAKLIEHAGMCAGSHHLAWPGHEVGVARMAGNWAGALQQQRTGQMTHRSEHRKRVRSGVQRDDDGRRYGVSGNTHFLAVPVRAPPVGRQSAFASMTRASSTVRSATRNE